MSEWAGLVTAAWLLTVWAAIVAYGLDAGKGKK